MKLLLDVMLGKLARYLRMAGHDTAYALDRGIEADDALGSLADAEGRTLITRDAALAEHIDDTILLTETSIDGQLREVRAAGIDLSLDRPERCSRCNGRVVRCPAETSSPAYAPSPGDQAVWRCRGCDQYYWRGSHWDDVRDRLRSL